MIHKAIKGFEDYLVTDTGRVYSLKSGRYLKLIKHPSGYYFVRLLNGQHFNLRVHRLVAETFIPNPENKPTVDHINRVRDDNRVQNLRWADYKEQYKNRDDINRKKVQKQKCGTPIIEVINEEVSVGYLTLREVPSVSHTALARHINKAQTDFICKGRHFIVPK